MLDYFFLSEMPNHMEDNKLCRFVCSSQQLLVFKHDYIIKFFKDNFRIERHYIKILKYGKKCANKNTFCSDDDFLICRDLERLSATSEAGCSTTARPTTATSGSVGAEISTLKNNFSYQILTSLSSKKVTCVLYYLSNLTI